MRTLLSRGQALFRCRALDAHRLRPRLRRGLRLLVKERWLTAVAVLVLALGIAANNTVFVLLNGIMLRDFPFAEPERLVTILSSVGGRARPYAGISYLDLQDWSVAPWSRRVCPRSARVASIRSWR